MTELNPTGDFDAELLDRHQSFRDNSQLAVECMSLAGGILGPLLDVLASPAVTCKVAVLFRGAL